MLLLKLSKLAEVSQEAKAAALGGALGGGVGYALTTPAVWEAQRDLDTLKGAFVWKGPSIPPHRLPPDMVKRLRLQGALDLAKQEWFIPGDFYDLAKIRGESQLEFRRWSRKSALQLGLLGGAGIGAVLAFRKKRELGAGPSQ